MAAVAAALGWGKGRQLIVAWLNAGCLSDAVRSLLAMRSTTRAHYGDEACVNLEACRASIGALASALHGVRFKVAGWPSPDTAAALPPPAASGDCSAPGRMYAALAAHGAKPPERYACEATGPSETSTISGRGALEVTLNVEEAPALCVWSFEVTTNLPLGFSVDTASTEVCPTAPYSAKDGVVDGSYLALRTGTGTSAVARCDVAAPSPPPPSPALSPVTLRWDGGVKVTTAFHKKKVTHRSHVVTVEMYMSAAEMAVASAVAATWAAVAKAGEAAKQYGVEERSRREFQLLDELEAAASTDDARASTDAGGAPSAAAAAAAAAEDYRRKYVT